MTEPIADFAAPAGRSREQSEASSATPPRAACVEFPRADVRRAVAERELTLRIGPLDCRGCARRAEEALRRVRGVRNAAVRYTAETAHVAYDVRRVSEREVIHAVQAVGYRVTPVPARVTSFDAGARALALVVLANLFAIPRAAAAVPTSAAVEVTRITLALLALGLSGAVLLRKDDRRAPPHEASFAMAVAAGAFVVGLLESLAATSAAAPTVLSLVARGVHAEVWRVRPGFGFEASAAIAVGALWANGLAAALLARAGSEIARRQRQSDGRARRLDVGGTETFVPVVDLQAGDRIRLVEGEAAPVELFLENSARFARATPDGVLAGAVRAGDRVPKGAVLLSSQGFARVSGASDFREAASDAEVRRAVARTGHRGALEPGRVASRALAFAAAVWAPFALFAHGALGPGRVTYESVAAALAVLAGASAIAFDVAGPLARALVILRARREGVVVRDARALERLASVTHACFDPPGTLTSGELRVARLAWLKPTPDRGILEASLALARLGTDEASVAVTAYLEAGGISPTILPGAAGVVRQGARVVGRFGDREVELSAPTRPALRGARPRVVFFGEPGSPNGYFQLEDPQNPSAPAAIRGLHERGVAAAILGDARPDGAGRLSHHLGVPVLGGAGDAEKALAVRELQHIGARVLLVTDGWSDLTGARQAEVTIAVAPSTLPSAVRAPIVVTHDRLEAVPGVLHLARELRARLRENAVLAAVFNAVLIPAAALGYVDPRAAAGAAAAQALVLLANTSRLGGRRAPAARPVAAPAPVAEQAVAATCPEAAST